MRRLNRVLRCVALLRCVVTSLLLLLVLVRQRGKPGQHGSSPLRQWDKRQLGAGRLGFLELAQHFADVIWQRWSCRLRAVVVVVVVATHDAAEE